MQSCLHSNMQDHILGICRNLGHKRETGVVLQPRFKIATSTKYQSKTKYVLLNYPAPIQSQIIIKKSKQVIITIPPLNFPDKTCTLPMQILKVTTARAELSRS